MHNPHHQSQINGLLVIISLFVVGALLWFMLASAPAPVAEPLPIAAPVTEGMLYANSAYGITFRYGTEFVVQSDEYNISHQWSSSADTEGIRLFTLSLPRDFQPGTNFSSAELALGVSTEQLAVAQCLSAKEGESARGIDRGFAVFQSTGAGAGNFYETTSRRRINNGACIALESIIHSTNIYNYAPEQGVSMFNRMAVENMLESVIRTLEVR